MLALVVASIIFGLTTQRLGYYTPSAIVGSCIMMIGAGLLTTLQVNTGKGKSIGYQILFGFGTGLCLQAPNLAAQTVLPTRDVPVGIALIFFGHLLGGAIFVPVGENILSNQLLKRLSEVPEFNSTLVTSGGATALISALPSNVRGTVLDAYNGALRDVFRIGLILSGLTVLGVAGLEWRSTFKKDPDAGGERGGSNDEKIVEGKTEHREEREVEIIG
jgi:MFS family permease